MLGVAAALMILVGYYGEFAGKGDLTPRAGLLRLRHQYQVKRQVSPAHDNHWQGAKRLSVTNSRCLVAASPTSLPSALPGKHGQLIARDPRFHGPCPGTAQLQSLDVWRGRGLDVCGWLLR